MGEGSREGGNGGKGEGETDPDLRAIMAEIKKLSLKVDNKFDEIQSSLESVKDEVSKLKANMVTHDIFQKLEDRVDKIESRFRMSL